MDVLATRPELWILPVISIPLLLIGLGLCVPEGAYLYSGRFLWGVMISTLSGLGVLTWLALLIPFQSQYHVLYSVEGEVTSVTNTIMEGSGELSSVPVVRLDSIDYPLTVNDPRVMGMEGQDATFTCSLGWVPYGAGRYNCYLGGD